MIDGITYKPFQSTQFGDFRALREDIENLTLLDKSAAAVQTGYSGATSYSGALYQDY